jgi:hypothetical protein
MPYIRVVDPNPHGSAFLLVGWIRILDDRGPEKVKKFKISSADCYLLRDKAFSFSLDVLYGGLRISKLQFFITKFNILFGCKFFQNFGHQNTGSGSTLTKNAGSGSALKHMRIHHTALHGIMGVQVETMQYL